MKNLTIKEIVEVTKGKLIQGNEEYVKIFLKIQEP